MSIYSMLKNAALLALGLTGILTSGCSTVMQHPFPGQEPSLTIGVTDKETGDDDWAPGSYHLPQANVCIAKVQGGEDAYSAQALFGLIGRAVAVDELAGEMKKTLKGQEDIYRLDMQNLTQDCLDQEINRTNGFGRFLAEQNWKKAPLQITPYAVLSFVDDYNARLWVALKVNWIDLTCPPKTGPVERLQ